MKGNLVVLKVVDQGVKPQLEIVPFKEHVSESVILRWYFVIHWENFVLQAIMWRLQFVTPCHHLSCELVYDARKFKGGICCGSHLAVMYGGGLYYCTSGFLCS